MTRSGEEPRGEKRPGKEAGEENNGIPDIVSHVFVYSTLQCVILAVMGVCGMDVA